MGLADWFSTFCSNIQVQDGSTISTRYKNITRRLNTDFWNTNSDTSHSLYVGSYTVLLIVCPNVGGGFSPPSESGELYQSLGVFPVGLQCLGQGLVQRVDGGKELIG